MKWLPAILFDAVVSNKFTYKIFQDQPEPKRHRSTQQRTEKESQRAAARELAQAEPKTSTQIEKRKLKAERLKKTLAAQTQAGVTQAPLLAPETEVSSWDFYDNVL